METTARSKMAVITGDNAWTQPDDVTTLILEHHMAAKRLGFSEVFAPLYSADALKVPLLEGTLLPVRFFADVVLPLVDAQRRGDEFTVATIVRRNSPLLSDLSMRAAADDQSRQLQRAAEAVRSLVTLWENAASPTLANVLRNIAETQLLEVPESLLPFVATPTTAGTGEDGDAGDDDDVVIALRTFLEAPSEQVRRYTEYISRQTRFGTHHGVKGLEFERVLVVVDDEEARGSTFSYEKLFGVKNKTARDRGNEESGRDTGLDSTRRLLYVTCSRAERSLAIVARSADPARVRQHAVAQGWFDEAEVEVLS